jgi:hypothetical protein
MILLYAFGYMMKVKSSYMNLAIYFLFLFSKFSHFWRLKTSEITFVFEVLIFEIFVF